MALDSSVLIIIGATGDLARRMLFPSLYYLEADGLIPADKMILGVALTRGQTAGFQGLIAADLRARGCRDEGVLTRLMARLLYVQANATDLEDARLIAEAAPTGERAIFLAVSPNLYVDMARNLRTAGVIHERTRLVLEKPLGSDRKSSRVINDAIQRVLPEMNLFRIDHYLGKETVQNLVALRFANSLFEPLWNREHIDHVQLTVAETEKVGSRWPYYDSYGALRDMVQNHMLQLLCLVAMEPPADMASDSVRGEKLKVLKSLRRPNRESVLHDTVIGQYSGGEWLGQYRDSYEEEVGKPSKTETFLAMRCWIDNWRWSGVPFFLRTGKRMAERRTQLVIQFKPLPHSIFDGAARSDLVANRLVIDLQPDEDISLLLMNKTPDLGPTRLKSRPLSLSLAEAGQRRRIAYERLLLDVFRGNRTHFVRRDELEEAWSFVDSISDAWQEAGMVVRPYAPGSWGPDDSAALIENGGRSWAMDLSSRTAQTS